MCQSGRSTARPRPPLSDRPCLPAYGAMVPQVVEQCCDFLLQRMDGSNCLVSED